MTTDAAQTSSVLRKTLHLRHRGDASSPPAVVAWLLLGSEPADWIAELVGWGTTLTSIRLLLLPMSATDRRAVAALAIPSDPKAVRPSRRALPYQCIAGRLYVPEEAQLCPPISEAEARELCPWPIAVIHPSLGLVACETGDELRASDLVRAQPAHASTWEDAQPASYSQPRVREVRLLIVPSVEDVMDASRDDIGNSPLDELPPSPDESILKQLGRQVRLGGVQALRNVLPQATNSAAASGMMNKLSRWAEARAQALSAQIDAARQRELSRLMRLLEQNPDEGLRYALPLNALPGARGVAHGGSRLARRDTNFHLGKLFGTRPTSFWETPWDAQQRLQARYRELANRELSLGRHRRAAYIFSVLLGDHHNAARALAEGRFYHEAAALYRDVLKNPTAAAQCLESGGLIHEAAHAYATLGQFEKAGDLFVSLDSVEEATRLYKLAVSASTARGDTLGAAAVLERKLGEPDTALARLTDAWEHASNQAEQCLKESFRLLARLTRHEAAEARLIDLRASAPHTPRPAALARVLVDVASEYPAKAARAIARDAARVVAGYALASDAHTLEHPALLKLVARTNVDDRLLHGDTIRFGESIKRKKPTPARQDSPVPAAFQNLAKRPRATLEEIARYSLPGTNVSWRSATSVDGGFIAMGVSEAQVIVARGDWDGHIQVATLPFAGAAETHFRMAGVDNRVVIVPLATHKRLPPRVLAPLQHFAAMQIGHASLVPDGALYGIAANDAGDFSILHAASPDADCVLDRVSVDGRLNSSLQTPIPSAALSDLDALWMLAHGNHLMITVGDRLHWLTRDVFQQPIDLPGIARGLSGAPRHTALRVVVPIHGGGCAMVWPQQPDVRSFATAIDDATAALLPDGGVVAVGNGNGALFELNARSISLVSDMRSEASPPARIIVSDMARRHVAVLYPHGLLLLLAAK